MAAESRRLRRKPLRSNLNKLSPTRRYMTTTQRLYDSDRWCIFCTDFLFAMTMEEAVVITCLLNYAKMQEREGKTEDWWFRCSSKGVCSSMNISRACEERLIRKLCERGFIKREMRGNPARRWLSIDFDAIDEQVIDGRTLATMSYDE